MQMEPPKRGILDRRPHPAADEFDSADRATVRAQVAQCRMT
jgi:hypothetical protein